MKKITKFFKNIRFNFKKKIDLDNLHIDNYSLDQLFNYFGTDKGTHVKNPYSEESNEILGHGFAKFYELKLKKLKNNKINILEIGTWEGASTASFSLYFPKSFIYGIDRNYRFKYRSQNIKFLNCNIKKNSDLKEFEKKFRNIKFGVIIDDGSHLLNDMIFSLKFFFKYLDKKGIYIIEDFNAPVYFKELNDGKKNELLIQEILKKIKKKQKFKSMILDDFDQDYLFKNISNVEYFKGKTKISDIAFLSK
ncbi:MAG: hypothetical protein CMP38_04465 [Rickettsiales bacterium]|nr:hypothetical protein [Rickettsiales bacterium]|tara:strand:+ start:1314 stop:2063 length:750 start_codon:yes stop_codon:yes gene_type:complete